MGDSEKSKKGFVAFNRVHITSQTAASQPQWPCVRQGAPSTRAHTDCSSPIPFLLALVRGAVSSVKCGYRQQFTDCALLLCVCWWDTGKRGWHSSALTNAYSHPWGQEYHEPRKTQHLAAWY